MSLSFLVQSAARVKWPLATEVSLAAAGVGLAFWLRPQAKPKPVVSILKVKTPATPRSHWYSAVSKKATKQSHKLLGLLPKSVASCVPFAGLQLPPSTPVVEKKKSVRFAEEKNEVFLVDKWIDRAIHQHPKRRKSATLAGTDQKRVVERRIVPERKIQLPLPPTKRSRDVDRAVRGRLSSQGGLGLFHGVVLAALVVAACVRLLV
ncbi:hypothetical protein MMC12_004086 [Toensbergia leucococca]|nr:hypothetical protein [Toensbergia leucococca]